MANHAEGSWRASLPRHDRSGDDYRSIEHSADPPRQDSKTHPAGPDWKSEEAFSNSTPTQNDSIRTGRTVGAFSTPSKDHTGDASPAASFTLNDSIWAPRSDRSDEPTSQATPSDLKWRPHSYRVLAKPVRRKVDWDSIGRQRDSDRRAATNPVPETSFFSTGQPQSSIQFGDSPSYSAEERVNLQPEAPNTDHEQRLAKDSASATSSESQSVSDNGTHRIAKGRGTGKKRRTPKSKRKSKLPSTAQPSPSDQLGDRHSCSTEVQLGSPLESPTRKQIHRSAEPSAPSVPPGLRSVSDNSTIVRDPLHRFLVTQPNGRNFVSGPYFSLLTPNTQREFIQVQQTDLKKQIFISTRPALGPADYQRRAALERKILDQLRERGSALPGCAIETYRPTQQTPLPNSTYLSPHQATLPARPLPVRRRSASSDDMATGFQQRMSGDARRFPSTGYTRTENRPPMSTVLCRNGPQCRKFQEGACCY